MALYNYNNIIDQIYFDEIPNTLDYYDEILPVSDSDDINLINFVDDNGSSDDSAISDNILLDYKDNFICKSIIKGIELLLKENDDDIPSESIPDINNIRNVNNYFTPEISRPKIINPNNNVNELYNEENKENCQFSMGIPPCSASTYISRRKHLSNYGNTKKIKKLNKTVPEYCVFCSNNGQPDYVYKTHKIRDSFGRIICPKLRDYKCPICGISGDNAHTTKYCPQKPVFTMEDASNMDEKRLMREKYVNDFDL